MGKIATLQIPVAGTYVVSAKLTALNNSPNGNIGRCVPGAGADFDEIRFGTTPVFGGIESSLAPQFVHAFGVPGSVTPSCEDGILGDLEAEDIKITAVQVAKLSNVPI